MQVSGVVAPVINSVEFLLKKTFEKFKFQVHREVTHQTTWPGQTGHKHYPTNKGEEENLQQNFLPSMVGKINNG